MKGAVGLPARSLATEQRVDEREFSRRSQENTMSTKRKLKVEARSRKSKRNGSQFMIQTKEVDTWRRRKIGTRIHKRILAYGK